jgi:hypothetical protein
MEKGDLFVLLSLVLLAGVFLYPFYRGRDMGSREASSLQLLLALRKQATDSGLVNKVQAAGESISEITGLRQQGDGPMLLPGTDATVLWQDGSYDYAIRFLGFLDIGPALLVSPHRPGETGTRQFVWSPGSPLEAKLLKDLPATGDKQLQILMASAENKAKGLAEKVVEALEESGLQEPCASMRSHKPRALTFIPERKFGCMSPLWTDGNYLFRISMAMTSGGLDLDLWAWPKVRGGTGFDAFFASGRSIPAQSWNMTSPYIGMDDLKSIPIPGAARDRSGAILGLKNNWVGWDGKRWFAVETEE